MKRVEFINRHTGETVLENVPAGGMMRFLYSQNFIGRFLLWTVIKRRLFSTIVGWYMVSSLSAKSVPKFIKKNCVDMSDYEVPERGFKHFNRFFYRTLKEGVRPINEGVISPADGKIVVFPSIASTQQFYVKGELFDLSKFFNSSDLASKYEGGGMAVIRLAPTDYHRFHFPISGYVGENERLNGFYYSVSPLALNQNMRIFCQNKREYVSIDSDVLGKVIMSEVGATLTGCIVQSHWPNIEVEKGDEKGYFAFGGSTIIVLFEKDKMTFSEDLILNTKNGYETAVKMGETIGTALNR